MSVLYLCSVERREQQTTQERDAGYPKYGVCKSPNMWDDK